MKHHDRSLVVILIVALFSLASLQALNVLLKYSDSSVLGETTTCKNYYYQCTANSECCSGFCNQDKKSCMLRPTQSASTPANITPIISKSPVATQSALCEEITRIQRTYCGTIITPPVTTPYPITTPFPTRLPSSKPTKAPVSGI